MTKYVKDSKNFKRLGEIEDDIFSLKRQNREKAGKLIQDRADIHKMELKLLDANLKPEMLNHYSEKIPTLKPRTDVTVKLIKENHDKIVKLEAEEKILWGCVLNE